jgi:hypothetical protein
MTAEIFNVFADLTYEDTYGTPEHLHHNHNRDEINTVSDAELEFRRLVQLNVQNNDDHFARSNKIGELHVYTDGRPIRFEKS